MQLTTRHHADVAKLDIYYCHAWALGALETPAAKLGGIDSH